MNNNSKIENSKIIGLLLNLQQEYGISDTSFMRILGSIVNVIFLKEEIKKNFFLFRKSKETSIRICDIALPYIKIQEILYLELSKPYRELKKDDPLILFPYSDFNESINKIVKKYGISRNTPPDIGIGFNGTAKEYKKFKDFFNFSEIKLPVKRIISIETLSKSLCQNIIITSDRNIEKKIKNQEVKGLLTCIKTEISGFKFELGYNEYLQSDYTDCEEFKRIIAIAYLHLKFKLLAMIFNKVFDSNMIKIEEYKNFANMFECFKMICRNFNIPHVIYLYQLFEKLSLKESYNLLNNCVELNDNSFYLFLLRLSGLKHNDIHDFQLVNSSMQMNESFFLNEIKSPIINFDSYAK